MNVNKASQFLKMVANFSYVFIILLVFEKHQNVNSASNSISSAFKLTKNLKPNGARNGFAQVSIWGNSSIPSILNSPSVPSLVASDDIGGNAGFIPQSNPELTAFRPIKANQKFKHFNLRLGKYFHLQATNAAVHHQVYYK